MPKFRLAGRQVEINPTLSDRVVRYFAPQRYVPRLRARIMAAVAEGGYVTRHKRRKFAAWNPATGDADADILFDLEDLRVESRDLNRTNPLAAGVTKTKLTSVVGAGLRMSPTVNRRALGLSDEAAEEIEAHLKAEWVTFAATCECDFERVSNFDELTRTAYLSSKESGDVFALLPMKARPGSPFETKIQIIEADRVSNPSRKQDSHRISGGIERSDAGEFVGIHISRFHPGDMRPGTLNEEWDFYAAFGRLTGRRNVLHVFDKRRPGQSRGVPDLAPVIEAIKQLGRYTQAEIDAAVVSAMFTVFIRSEGAGTLAPMQPTDDTGASVSDGDIKLMAGGIVGLGQNESIETANPGRPNDAFDPFVLSVLRLTGAALEIPFELLVKHFTSSYSAGKASLNEAWKYFISERALLAARWCQPIYEAVIWESVLKNRIRLRGFTADAAVRRAWIGSTWIGPGKGQINEVQEIDAAIKRMGAGVSTGAAEAAGINGSDFDQNVTQRGRELAQMRDVGLVVEPTEDETPAPGQQDVEERRTSNE